MPFVLSAVMGYVLGCINPAYILGRLKGIDIRKYGSSNAGASNAMMVMGVKVSVAVALFDILKAFAAVRLAALLFPDAAYAPMIAGAACVVGHIFPAPLNFRGGKGFAAMGGMIIAVSWKLALLMLVIVALVVLLSDYIAMGAVTTAVLFPFMWLVSNGDKIAVCIIAAASLCMLIKHRENFKRMANDSEVHLRRAKPGQDAPKD